MKSLKKLTAIAITGALCLCSATAAFAANFSDMPSGDMGTAIENAVNNGLLTGYEDGTVKPNDAITRAQMSAIIVRAFGVTENAATSFKDVASSAWYKDSVEKAVYMGAFQGDENGNFNPEKNITFQETYTVLARVFQFTGRKIEVNNSYVMTPDDNCLNSFPDKDEVAGWAADYAKAVVDNGGYKGIDGKLKPTQSISRGEFAMVMDQLVNMYIDAPGAYNFDSSTYIDGSVIIRSGGVDINGLKTNNNVIFGYGVDSPSSLNNTYVKKCIVLYGGTDKTPIVENGKKRADECLIKLNAYINDCRIFAPCSLTTLEWLNEDPRTVSVKCNYVEGSQVQFSLNIQ